MRVLLFAVDVDVDVDVVVVGTRESGELGLEVGNACDGWYCWWDAWEVWDGVPARCACPNVSECDRLCA